MRRYLTVIIATVVLAGQLVGCTEDEAKEKAVDTTHAISEVVESEEFDEAADETNEFIKNFIKIIVEAAKKAADEAAEGESDGQKEE